MTANDRQFDEFDAKIRLNSERREKIKKAIAEFEGFANSDPQLKEKMAAPSLLQGSVKTNTVIKPMKGDDFDVDLIYRFRVDRLPENLRSPNAAFNWFKGRLAQKKEYEGRIKPKNRCVRIEYSGEFHIDLIPSAVDVPNVTPLAVPARDLKTWIKNDPEGFASWLDQLDRRSGDERGNGGRLVRAIRALKRWRDRTFGEDQAPSSIVLVAMLGNHEPTAASTVKYPWLLYPRSRNQAAYVHDLLRLTAQRIVEAKAPILHPTIAGENLAGEWAPRHLELFLKKLDAAIASIKSGHDDPNENSALGYYRSVFGDEFGK